MSNKTIDKVRDHEDGELVKVTVTAIGRVNGASVEDHGYILHSDYGSNRFDRVVIEKIMPREADLPIGTVLHRPVAGDLQGYFLVKVSPDSWAKFLEPRDGVRASEIGRSGSFGVQNALDDDLFKVFITPEVGA